MLPEMIASYRTNRDHFVKIDKVHSIGTYQRKDGKKSISHIIIAVMYKYKNAYKRNKFENNGADRNISILFQSFIQPLHTKGVEKDQNTHDEKQRLFLPEPWGKKYGGKKGGV